MTWKGKRVLVTGAGGFIGSHLAERLVKEGATVRALVHYNALGSWGWLDQSTHRREMEVIAGDICDRESVSHVMLDQEVVFHLAALIAIPYSYRAPASFLRTNIEGTMNLLQAAREQDLGCLIHTSTSEVYGTARYAPIDEGHPLRGQSPYAASKIAADKMAEAFHLSYGLRVVTVRPFNTFGPRQSARAVIPTIISQCLASHRIALGNLQATRDFNYVENTVDGFLAAAANPEAVGQVFNLGSGQEISVGKLTEEIIRLTGRTVAIEQKEERIRPEKSEVGRLLASTKLANQVLGWWPKISLDEGLRRTISWVEDHLDRFRSGLYSV